MSPRLSTAKAAFQSRMKKCGLEQQAFPLCEVLVSDRLFSFLIYLKGTMANGAKALQGHREKYLYILVLV